MCCWWRSPLFCRHSSSQYRWRVGFADLPNQTKQTGRLTLLYSHVNWKIYTLCTHLRVGSRFTNVKNFPRCCRKPDAFKLWQKLEEFSEDNCCQILHLPRNPADLLSMFALKQLSQSAPTLLIYITKNLLVSVTGEKDFRDNVHKLTFIYKMLSLKFDPADINCIWTSKNEEIDTNLE